MLGRLKRSRCRACGADLIAETLERLEGREAEAVVELAGVPALACPSGHVRRMVSPDDSNHLILELQDRLPHADPGGKCQACGGRARADREPGVFDLDVELPSGPTMGFRLRAPSETCEQCGHIQLDGDRIHGDTIAEATLQAYRAGEVKR